MQHINKEMLFAPIPMARRCLQDGKRSIYHIYTSKRDYQAVEATTAIEAMRASGVAKPFKIVRMLKLSNRLLDKDKLTEADNILQAGMVKEEASAQHEEINETPAPDDAGFAPAADLAAQPTPMPEPEASDKPQKDGLSSDDISALLGGEEKEA